MRVYVFVRVLLLSLSLLTLLLAVPVLAELPWNIQVVDENALGIGNGHCPIVVDSDGKPHIAYNEGPRMSYASMNGSGWSIQQLDYGGYVYDLALDANGAPHITFGNVYARWNGSGWNTQTVSTDQIFYSSLALDSSGKPRIAYVSGNELKYASQKDSGWDIQTVDVLPEINSVLSLALDPNDTPYIMYSSPSTIINSTLGGARYANIKLAIWKDSNWNIETISTSPDFGDFGNMVLDSKGYPHFLATQNRYLSADEPTLLSTILHVSWDGSSWNAQTVVSNVSLAHIGFLALSQNDYPHIVYVTGEVVYTRWTGTAWESYTVDSDRGVIGKPLCYLAVDSNGTPHISYFKGFWVINRRLDLMYATANLTEPKEVSVLPDFTLLIVSTAIIIGTVIAVIAYIRKKKP